MENQNFDQNQTSQEERKFTQADVDRILGERLGREGISDMKEVIEHLKEFGYEGTPAEIKAMVKADAEDFRQQQAKIAQQEQLDALKEQAKNEGTTPQLLARIDKLEKQLSDYEGEREAHKNAVKQQQTAAATARLQVKYFAENEETKDINLAALKDNPKFQEFMEDLRITDEPEFLVKAYKKFKKLVGDAEAAAIAKINANLDRSTASGRTKGDSSGGTYGLSAAQIELVDDFNRKNPKMKMSYKQYAEKL
jgi:vacuolar-type H+-ATPase subunit I/STV1